MTKFRARACLAALLLLASGACGGPTEPTASGQAPASVARIDAKELRAEHDRFPSLTDPAHVSEDVSWLQPDDEIIGVEVNGEARAYPTWTIGYHHLVNDRLGGRAILVTY